ncbi:MAG TPA: cytochrome c5 family protein, partial [Actinomycetota bacterium]|nr:cytochrome c5 family protein [Actinomycetota bacterium]
GAPAAAEAPPSAAAPAPAAAAEVDHTPPEIDQETYDREIAAGKSDRVARALAKKAWVVKRRKGQS